MKISNDDTVNNTMKTRLQNTLKGGCSGSFKNTSSRIFRTCIKVVTKVATVALLMLFVANIQLSIFQDNTGIKSVEAQASNCSGSEDYINGACTTRVEGCTSIYAQNYNPLATFLDGSCIYYIYGCTDPTASNYNSYATFDNGSCGIAVWGCMYMAANNFNPAANIENGSCIYDTLGCTDFNALNYNRHANTDDGSCFYVARGCTDPTGDNYDPFANTNDGSCTYRTGRTGVCCSNAIPAATNLDPNCANIPNTTKVVDNTKCEYDVIPTYCCDGNWHNYTKPSDRLTPRYCEYGEPTCSCEDPFWAPGTFVPNGSACGVNNNNFTEVCCDSNAENFDPNCGLLGEFQIEFQEACIFANSTSTISVVFTVTKSGVAISGNATTSVADPVESNDYDILAAMAAADATPNTPLNTPISLDALTEYTVVSKDYCLNIDETQGLIGHDRTADGFCCVLPDKVNAEGNDCIPDDGLSAVCNATTISSGPYENEDALSTTPPSNLCTTGTPSAVTETLSDYTWQCTEDTSTVSCAANRTCGGSPCVDLCSNIDGDQDTNYLSMYNLISDGNNECWNNLSGACGTVHQLGIPVKEAPTTNLCTSDAILSGGVNYQDSPTAKWTWSCASIQNPNIAVLPVCEVLKCVEGGPCNTSTLITSLKIEPTIVSTTNNLSILTWITDIDGDTDNNIPNVCKLNGNSVYGAGYTIYDDDQLGLIEPRGSQGLLVPPGTYELSCTYDGNTQTKSVKSTVRPDFKEI